MKNDFVYINRLSSFFPNRPVENDEMEQYIGLVNEKSLLAKRLVLGKNGIKRRYYALDKSGRVTHTNAVMAANAVRGLLDEELTLDKIDLLSCGTASPEQVMPSHGVMVHGELKGSRHTEVVSFAGSCCTGMQALKYAHYATLAGDAANAVCVASERLSAWMMARYFEKESELLAQLDKRPMLAFEKEFLRWMLSDGSVALLLQGKPSDNDLSYRIEWIELTSFANETETCMYAGGDKNEKGELLGWTQFPEKDWLDRSIFSLKQDTRLLENNIVKLGGRFLREIAAKRNFDPSSVDWFMPHLSSMYFAAKIEAELKAYGYDIPGEKWFVNLPETGNVASVSAFAMLDDLKRSGRAGKGDRILIMVPESARFTYAYALLTIC
ncbi:MAG: beta-ketoacyl-ACP synthase III [Tannerella sp.]|jgi:3-oxoacyl-[acyl-carrier-protein] synthase-3|nr:beta-ketoacyl-ACP synthase III [Tannerella sp.]